MTAIGSQSGTAQPPGDLFRSFGAAGDNIFAVKAAFCLPLG